MRKITTLMLMLGISIAMMAQNVNVSFKLRAIDENGQPVDTLNGVWIVGSMNNWNFQQLEDLGNHEYILDTALKANDTINFYFILVNSWDSAGNQDWNYYKRYREYPDTANAICNPSYAEWKGDRWTIIPNHDTVIYVAWGKCESLNSTAIQTNTMLSQTITVYPNPAKGLVNIKLPATGNMVTVELFDIAGKRIKSLKTSAGQLSLDITGLPSNVYFIKASDNNETVTRKLIVQ